MKNRVDDGVTLLHTAGSAIASGDVVVMVDTVGFAVNDIANGEVGGVAISGKFDVTAAQRTSSQAWLQGDTLYFDTGASEFTNVVATNKKVGLIALDADADTAGQIVLNNG